jgi:hypothetical protein
MRNEPLKGRPSRKTLKEDPQVILSGELSKENSQRKISKEADSREDGLQGRRTPGKTDSREDGLQGQRD